MIPVGELVISHSHNTAKPLSATARKLITHEVFTSYCLGFFLQLNRITGPRRKGYIVQPNLQEAVLCRRVSTYSGQWSYDSGQVRCVARDPAEMDWADARARGREAPPCPLNSAVLHTPLGAGKRGSNALPRAPYGYFWTTKQFLITKIAKIRKILR